MHSQERDHILFANAGIAKYAALENITEELYDSIFNVKGVLFTVQKAPISRASRALSPRSPRARNRS
jgi:NAD(P)-dependent dehydrogenase (short-subunit alcohol dehydrogenase family)